MGIGSMRFGLIIYDFISDFCFANGGFVTGPFVAFLNTTSFENDLFVGFWPGKSYREIVYYEHNLFDVGLTEIHRIHTNWRQSKLKRGGNIITTNIVHTERYVCIYLSS